jgi:hypothetical protein
MQISVGIAGDPIQIRIKHFLNTGLRRCINTNMFDESQSCTNFLEKVFSHQTDAGIVDNRPQPLPSISLHNSICNRLCISVDGI